MENDFAAQDYIDVEIKKIKDKVGNKQVICTVSGGLKSSVTALISNQALGNQLHFIFIDTGLLRHNEAYDALSFLRNDLNLNVWHIDAKKLFLSRLENIIQPEIKTKIIKNTFFDVLIQAAKDLNIEFNYLIDQSNCFNNFENSLGINLQVIEPLMDLSRNNVKEIADILNLPKTLVKKPPFPISGLAKRVIGKVTKSKLNLIRKSDYIFTTLMQDIGLDLVISNYFCVLLNNDFQEKIANLSKNIILLKAFILKSDGTSEFANLPYNFLKSLSDQICFQIPEISSVFYDVSNKLCSCNE